MAFNIRETSIRPRYNKRIALLTEKQMFTHLHLHTEYSLIDGLSNIPLLIERAKALGMTSLAITDHGNVHGIVDFYIQCKEAGIKPIIGCELYVAIESRHLKNTNEKSPYHLTVICKNNVGYKNLLQLITKANVEGFYYKPRIDRELLEEHKEGLIILSGCPQGDIPRLLIDGNYEEAKEVSGWFQATFENFYLEIQRHEGIPLLEPLNAGLLKLNQELGIPLVATNDLHYVCKDDAYAHDVLLCIRTNTTIETDQRMKMSDDSYYLKSPEEMTTLFSDLPSAINTSGTIADMCDVSLDFSSLHLPEYSVNTDETAQQYLEKLAVEGLNKRYNQPTDQANERLRYELNVIEQTQFANYFLVVWDIASFAAKQDILFGVRGSAAASLVLYSLGVTEIDPLRYKLVFERFLNIERKEMPDIDMDFQDDRRDEIIQYITNLYGAEHVAQIVTFGTLGAKAAIRDVGRALGYPYAEVDSIARSIPIGPNMTLEQAASSSEEFRGHYEGSDRYRKLIDTAKELEGVVRHASTHAAGVVISKEPLTHHVPLQRPVRGDQGEGNMTQFPMYPIAKLGLLKMDILGLTNFTSLSKVIPVIKEVKNEQLNLKEITLEDPKTFELLASGETTGIFQLESAGMRKYIKELKPTSLGDISAMIALYRPGPMEHIDTFIKAKHGLREVKYPHPVLQDILQETYGVIVYQDQVILILQAFAGYSLGEADIVRKAMGKKIPELMALEKEKFLTGAKERGYSLESASEVFSLIQPFAGYAFNKAHSVSYALVAYRTAYFKANYPVEYMSAVLNSHLGNVEKTGTILSECRRLQIGVLPPDITQSDVSFTVESDSGSATIRYGLGGIKNVGANAVKELVKTRIQSTPIGSIEEACRRGYFQGMNKRTIESLIKAGAFDVLGKRGALLSATDKIVGVVQQEAKLKDSGQTTMFDLFGDTVEAPLAEIVISEDDATDREKAGWESELLGIHLTGGLASLVGSLTGIEAIVTVEDFESRDLGTRVKVVGQVFNVRNLFTKDKRPFSIVELELLDGKVTIFAWPEVYEKTRGLWFEGSVVFVVGKTTNRDGQVAITCYSAEEYIAESKDSAETEPISYTETNSNSVSSVNRTNSSMEFNKTERSSHVATSQEKALPNPPDPFPKTIVISLRETDQPVEDEHRLKELLQLLLEYPGKDNFMLSVETKKNTVAVDFPGMSIEYSPTLHGQVTDLLGNSDCIQTE